MIGQTVGNYRVTSKLGEGGMGAVYIAEHAMLGRKAVIKVLLPELVKNTEAVKRFFNEAKATTAIRHPSIVEVFDFGFHTDGSAYLVIELLEGETLTARIARSPIPLEMSLYLTKQLATALAAAHEKQIIHRDLKPDNIFLVPDPESPAQTRVKILDFGIAKLAEAGQSATSQTRTGAIMGTPVYMSPEQCRGAKLVDARSDIYALGCILYELVCRRPPFVLEGIGEVMAAHIHVPVEPPSKWASGLPGGVEQAIVRMLAKLPEDRPQSMTEVVGEMSELLGAIPGGSALITQTGGMRNVAMDATVMRTGDGIPKRTTQNRTGNTGLKSGPNGGVGTGTLTNSSFVIDSSRAAGGNKKWGAAIAGVALLGGAIAVVAMRSGKGKGDSGAEQVAAGSEGQTKNPGDNSAVEAANSAAAPPQSEPTQPEPTVDDSKALAEEHFKRGTQLLAADALDDAIREYKQAYQLDPQRVEILFDLARATRLSGDWVNSIKLYEEYLAKVADTPGTAEARKEAKSRIETIRAALNAKDAGSHHH